MNIATLLDRCEYFRDLSFAHKRALAGYCRLQTLKKREVLFAEGQPGEALFLLAEGGVQLFKTAPDGREVVIKTVEPAEVFAEVVLFEQETYPVTAVALQPSQVYAIERRNFYLLLQEEEFRHEFVGLLMRRLRYLTRRILYLTTCDVEERFFHFLREQYGLQEEYHLSLSKKDLAAAIDTTPETLSRLLLRLKQQGTLTWEGKLLRLPSGFWEDKG